MLHVVNDATRLEASKVEQGRDAGVKQRTVLHGHRVLVRAKPRHGFLKRPAPRAFGIGRGSGEVFGRDATGMVAVGGFDRLHHLEGDRVRGESRDFWKGNGAVPREAVLCVKRPLSTHRFSVLGQQHVVGFPCFAVEGIHPPRAFVAHRAVEKGPVGQPARMLFDEKHSTLLQRFQRQPCFPFCPPHGVKRAEGGGLLLEHRLVRSIVMKHQDGMASVLCFQSKMPQVGQHKRQFLLMIRTLLGLPRGFHKDQSNRRAWAFRGRAPRSNVEVELVHMDVTPTVHSVPIDGKQGVAKGAHSGPPR